MKERQKQSASNVVKLFIDRSFHGIYFKYVEEKYELVAEYICKMFEIYQKYVNLSKHYEGEKEYEKAIEYYKETIAYDALKHQDFLQKGIECYNANEYLKAIAYYKASCDEKLYTYTEAYDEENKYAY